MKSESLGLGSRHWEFVKLLRWFQCVKRIERHRFQQLTLPLRDVITIHAECTAFLPYWRDTEWLLTSRRTLLQRNKGGRTLLLINIIYYVFKNSFLHFVHVGWQNKCRQFTNHGTAGKMGRGSRERGEAHPELAPSPLPHSNVVDGCPESAPPPGVF